MQQAVSVVVALLASTIVLASAQSSSSESWVTSWTASAHGPYPSGNAVAQPVLDFAFESPATGARDQTFRLVIRPDLWGSRVRIRFTNAFGTTPVTFDDVFVGLRASAGAIVTGTNVAVRFDNGATRLTLAPGTMVWSDAVTLPFAARPDDPLLDGRSLAVSFHVAGSSGPMTWHAKALATSYITAPGTGSHGNEVLDSAFPYTSTSWYFVDALDVMAPAETPLVVCFGDSITDGTASTINGDDRWPDVFARRMHSAYGRRVSIANAGIGGNRIVGPANYTPATPFAGGPGALNRLERDVLSLSGVKALIWLEGINDISAGTDVQTIEDGIREGVRRLKARGVRVVMATITSALGSTGGAGTPDGEAKRQAVNTFIRTSGLFDGVVDFDAATVDPATGALRAAFQPNSSIGGAGDHLHPNRAGYQAMGEAIDVNGFGIK